MAPDDPSSSDVNPYAPRTSGDGPDQSNPDPSPVPPPYPYYVPDRVAPVPTNPKAIWSLVLGIVSLFAGMFLFWLYAAGIVIGIPAIILGLMARKEIRANYGRQRGDGQALAGVTTAIIGTALNMAWLIFFLVAFFFGHYY